jgi:hypothetical protein
MERPGFAELLCDLWANAGQPLLLSHEKMHNVTDGTAWHKHEVGLKHEYLMINGQVVDLELTLTSRKKIVEYRFGLQFAVNLDW